MKATLGALVALFIFTGATLANGVPVRTRSAYGQAGSLIVDQASATTNGVTIASQEFCAEAVSDPTTGACRLAFAFQITSTLPANATSLTLTLPVPSSGIQPSAGLLTNDDPILGGNVFFSPFSQNDVLGLLDSAILFGTDGSGNPFFTFALPFPLTGHGTGLSVFMDVLSNSASGDYCFPTVAGVCTQDTPSLPVVGVDLATNSVPEPTSFSLLASGLLGLGFLRRKLQNS